MRAHMFSGERCIHCGVNVYDCDHTNDECCVEREPLVYTSATPGAIKSYRASVTREGEWYVIDVEGVGATQARRLIDIGSTLQDMMRAVLGDVEWLDDYTIEWINKEEK